MRLILQNKPTWDGDQENRFVSKIVFDILLAEESSNWTEYSLEINTPEISKKWQGENLKLSTNNKLNELKKLYSLISSLLDNKIEKFTFEPIEPNFELEIQKINNDYKLYFWVDAGNYLDNSHYTWDALGIRFILTYKALVQFAEGLDSIM